MRAPSGAASSRPVPAPMRALTDPGGATAGPPMTATRRAIGVLILSLAILTTVAARSLLSAGTTGSATPAALPSPPPVGACVFIASDDIVVVPCDVPHSGEVAKTWAPGETPAAKRSPAGTNLEFSVTRSLPQTGADHDCFGWVDEYTGWERYIADHRSELWFPPQPLTTGMLVAAPAGQGLPARHWSACIAMIDQPLYTGIIRDAAQGRDRPDAVSVCLTHDDGTSFPACTEPHTAELLATAALTQDMMFHRTLTTELTETEIHRQCVDLAVRQTGNADPTYGGRLEIVTESVWQPTSTAASALVRWVIPDCMIRVVGTGQLTGSVVGLGTAPLPFRGN